MTLSELRRLDFSLADIHVSRHTWEAGVYNDYRETGREHTLVHLVLTGERNYIVDDRSFTVGAGTMLLIPACTRYYTVPGTACTGIGVCLDFMTAEGPIQPDPDVYHGWQDHGKLYAGWMEALLEDSLTDRRGILYRKALLWRILDRMLSELDTDPELEKQLTPAIRFMAEHYRENLPVSACANACHLSESHFRRKFLAFTGMTPIAYRDSLRFAEVRRLLETGITLTKAAELTGFWDASYLRRMYRQRTGKAFLENDKNNFV